MPAAAVRSGTVAGVEERERVLRAFVRDGKLRSIPVKAGKRQVVLDVIVDDTSTARDITFAIVALKLLVGGPVFAAYGARLVVSLLHELRRRDGRYGLATLCVGVGQGVAALFER